MVRKKICALGAVAVGKTSLLRRFVHGIFSDDYQSTIGVKIDTKTVETDRGQVQLVLWDLDGHADFDRVRGRYLEGCAGYFLVIDGTRAETVDWGLSLLEAVREISQVPCVCLLNKRDLDDEWQLDADTTKRLTARDVVVLETSARTGDGVEEAFMRLTQLVT